MAYVPGYQHDVFISYAHGDDRQWVERLVDRLEAAVKQRLGVKPAFWMDDDALRTSRDFTREIPASVESSAVFLLFPSPSYIRSAYCVDQECKAFEKTIAARRSRFGPGFANDLFALRCPILPVDDNEHWSLFPGLTDIPFCDEQDTLTHGSPAFEAAFKQLVGELVVLLKRLRNQSTAVFLYPPNPGPGLQAAYKALSAELSANSYRILPDHALNLEDQLRSASLAVFLLGTDYDDVAKSLTDVAASRSDLPWVIWISPDAERTAVADQTGFCAYLEQLDSSSKTFLDATFLPAKVKEEVLSLLRSDQQAQPAPAGKPRVYLVYNASDRAEVRNAGLISFHFRDRVQFEHPDDPAQHTARLSRSEGVLLVWGSADENWCSREFAEMVQSAKRSRARGLCLFDPVDTKTAHVQQIREGFGDLYIGEEYGRFDPARLTSFFTRLMREPGEPAS
jgi:hypothetical protein